MRELHVEKALKVLNTGTYVPLSCEKAYPDGARLIGECEYFTVKEYKLDSESATIRVDKSSFKALTVVCGEGELSAMDDKYSLRPGDSFFIPAADTEVTISGNLTVITVEV